MSISNGKLIERSVDSLQKIYAVIVALAISISIQNLLLNKTDNSFVITTSIFSYLPAFLSFIVILVPFYHGMNRHLDKCYVERTSEDTIRGALLFDFIVFFFEASILFAVASSIRAGLQSFYLLGTLLVADMAWVIVSHWIHYRKYSPTILWWAGWNFLAIVISLFIVLLEAYPESSKMWLLFVVALSRSVADYWSCWEFYFPKDSENNKTTG